MSEFIPEDDILTLSIADEEVESFVHDIVKITIQSITKKNEALFFTACPSINNKLYRDLKRIEMDSSKVITVY